MFVWNHLAGRTFTGMVSRFTDKVNTDTRTMIVEMDVPESQSRDRPRNVRHRGPRKVEGRAQALSIPIEAAGSRGQDHGFTWSTPSTKSNRAPSPLAETPARESGPGARGRPRDDWQIHRGTVRAEGNPKLITSVAQE